MKLRVDGTRLERAALIKGWNLSEVADKAGVGITTVRMVFAGAGSPKMVKKVADALEVPLEQIYPEQQLTA